MAQEEIMFTNSFVNDTNLFLSFSLIASSFFLYVWNRGVFLKSIKENKSTANALRAFILSISGFGVFLTFYKVFGILEERKISADDKFFILFEIGFSSIVLVFALTVFFLTIPRKKKAAII
jgi:nicotinamide riboside transporter PnuC